MRTVSWMAVISAVVRPPRRDRPWALLAAASV